VLNSIKKDKDAKAMKDIKKIDILKDIKDF